ncbi:MAG: stage II sporulation protein M [Solirubrobacterales bacterium]
MSAAHEATTPVQSSQVPPEGNGEAFALAEGVRDSRAAFKRWERDPGSVLIPWFTGAVLIAAGLLVAVWFVSLHVTPDTVRLPLPGVGDPPGLADLGHILGRNLLVLALHATACVAGFIAGSSMHRVAATKSGFSRALHERAGQVAIAWVGFVTVFSLLTQALGLGMYASTLADQLAIPTWQLVLTVLPHALLELTAVFLPLAAWLIASRRGQWDELLAATFVTVALALPMILLAAAIELEIWPRIIESVSPVVG